MRGLKPPNSSIRIKPEVASFTDAWIETTTGASPQAPTQVASFTDAWIETIFKDVMNMFQRSHLLQMRGLKLCLRKRFRIGSSRIFYRCVD